MFRLSRFDCVGNVFFIRVLRYRCRRPIVNEESGRANLPDTRPVGRLHVELEEQHGGDGAGLALTVNQPASKVIA